MTDTEENSILIVDDREILLDILNEILSPVYTIYKAENGRSALELAVKHKPDLILLDIVMPDMDGYEVMALLKDTKETQEIPIIFITSMDSVEDEEKGLALGAVDFIRKPFNNKTVIHRVRNQIQIINQIRTIKKNAHEEAVISEKRSKFFARMSHEMRTPLNAVIGLSEMVLTEGGLSEKNQVNIEKIADSGISLLGLVNDILDISKIESGMFKLMPVEYYTSSMVSDAVNQSIILKGEKPVVFKIEVGKNIPSRLFGDDLRIRQILNNLLSNAFKYTKEGTVELCIMGELSKNKDAVLTVSIKDTGIGIKSEDVKNIFSDYIQADLKTNKYTEGIGLGLSITKMMTEMMGGIISVESEYGKGSTFTVKIPQKIIDSRAIGADIINDIKNFKYTGKRRRQPLKERIILPYARLLIVDDVVYNLDVAKGIMNPYKMQLDCITSGQEAVDAVREEKVRYDAIFMDHMMPDMDGIEAVRIIREEIGTDYAKNIPIIAFTANAIAGSKEMFLSRGFQDFISKPVDIHRLDEVIKRWIRDEEKEKLIDLEEHVQKSGFGKLELGEIEGINQGKCLERFSGNINTFLEILQSFTVNTRRLLDIIMEVNGENLQNYAIHIHGVKSSCRGVCAEALGLRAEALEKAAKAGNLDFVIANNSAFIEDVIKLIDNIKDALSRRLNKGKPHVKPKKDKPYTEALLNLKTACDKYQIEKIDLAMSEIECFDYTADDGLVLWLRENVNQMNYMEVAGKLEEII